jgi:hypothetical protein
MRKERRLIMTRTSGQRSKDLLEKGLVEALEWGLPESPEFSEVERLMNEFQDHERQEEKFLLQYREIAKTSPNALVRFLLHLIVADEEKHHAVTQLMVSTLKADLTWTRQQDTIQGLHELESEDPKLLAITEDFVQLERDGIREYQNLIKASKGYYHGLFTLLCGSMIRDSEKHVAILEFLRDKLKGK